MIRWFIQATRPFVHRLAHAYDIRLERPLHATGRHPIIAPPDAGERIPKSCVFNTRSGSIKIGRDVVLGEDVHLLTGKHLSLDEAQAAGVPLHHVPESGRDIVIGDGVYIGSMAIVIGPANIGDYAVIGAGAVVTSSVPARSFVAGVPAKVIRTF